MATFILPPSLETNILNNQEHAPIVYAHPGVSISTTRWSMEAFGSEDGSYAYPSYSLMAVVSSPSLTDVPSPLARRSATLHFGMVLSLPDSLPLLELTPEGLRWLVWRDALGIELLRINRSFLRTLKMS